MREDYLSENTLAITPYVAGEQPQDKKYIKLNTNENPFPPSPRVAEFLRNADAADLRLYPDPDAKALTAAIAEAKGVDAENVFIGNGSDEVLAHCFKAFFNPNRGELERSLKLFFAPQDDIVFADITYSFYPVYCSLFNIPYRTIPLREKFVLDVSDYLRLKKVQGIVIANPNAPTGRAIALSDIEKILTDNSDIVVIVDEAYVDFHGESCIPLVRKYRNLVVVQTFSKSYSLAGIRCGYAVAHPYLIGGLKRVKDSFNSYPVDRLCQGICECAIRDTAYHTRTVFQVADTRDWLAEQLTGIGCRVIPSRSNFLFVSVPNLSGEEVYLRLKAAGILVRYFAGAEISRYVRITVGTREDSNALIGEMKKLI